MGISPRIVTEDVRFLWDGVSQRLPKGQLIDVVPGSPLEAAIGAERLVPMPGTVPQTLPQEPPEPLATGGLITEAEMAHVGESSPETVAEPVTQEAPERQEKPPVEPAAETKKQDSDDEKDGDS
jgi:hypothetical protein